MYERFKVGYRNFLCLVLFYVPISAMREDRPRLQSSAYSSLINGPIEELKKFVEQMNDVNLPDREGFTLLAHALDQGNDEVQAVLRDEYGACINKILKKKSGEFEGILRIALNENSPNLLAAYLKQGADPKQTVYGVPPLIFVAFRQCSTAHIPLLLKAGAELNAHIKGGTALCWAIKNKSYEHAEVFLKAGANPNYYGLCSQKEVVMSPLQMSFLDEDMKMFELLLKYKANGDCAWDGDRSMLGVALTENHTKALELLLFYKSSINHGMFKEEILPLEYCIMGDKDRYYKYIEPLLKVGADPNALIVSKDGKKYFPLDLAFTLNDRALGKLLISYGAKTSASAEGGNLLTRALLLDDPSWFEMLVSAKDAPLDEPMSTGSKTIAVTPLKHCWSEKKNNHIRMLIKAGANPNIIWAGYTLLGGSLFCQETSKIKLLLESKRIDLDMLVNPESRDKELSVPLEICFLSKRLDHMELLLQAGANPDIRLKGGKTLLHLAVAYQLKDAITLLLKYNARKDIKDYKGRLASDFFIK